VWESVTAIHILILLLIVIITIIFITDRKISKLLEVTYGY